MPQPTNHSHEYLQARACAILQGSFKLVWVEQELQIHDGAIDAVGKQPWGRHIVAVECKATRSDLKQDLRAGKWKKYLPYCNELWFLCNRGICAPDEIPREAGIMFATPDGQSAKYRLGRKPPHGWKCNPRREVAPDKYCMVIEGMFSKQVWRPSGWEGKTSAKEYRRRYREWEDQRKRMEAEIEFLRGEYAKHGIDPQVPAVDVRQIRHYQDWKDSWVTIRRNWICPECGGTTGAYRPVKIGDMMTCNTCQTHVKVGGLPAVKEGPGPEEAT